MNSSRRQKIESFIQNPGIYKEEQVAKQHCVWILRPAAPGINALYCGKDVRWTMTKDDDGRPVRKYDHLCPEHRGRADYMEERDEV